MLKAESYRERARRLRVMAHEQPPMQRQLLEISQQYDRLADQAEMLAEPLPKPATGRPGPAMGPAERRRATSPRR